MPFACRVQRREWRVWIPYFLWKRSLHRKSPLKREIAMHNKSAVGKPNVFARVLAFVGGTLLCVVLALLGVVWVLVKGPSPSMTELFCRTVQETSALRWVPGIFLTEEERAAYRAESTAERDTEEMDVSLIRLDEIQITEEDGPAVELISIANGNCRGKLLIVRDPRQVMLGVTEPMGQVPGMPLIDMVEKYGGIAGTNAGGFVDDMGRGNGGIPTGLVISDGKLLWGDRRLNYHVIGLDYDGLLIVGKMTAQEALDRGIRWGVSFITHDGIASSLVINGEIQTQNLSGGVNPRTAIGQRADGAILLLVLDGRSISTLGATLENVCDIMLSYGAMTVGNLDGGSSSLMVYEGEIVNVCSSVTGPRSVPTAFVVLKEAPDEN